MNQFVWICLIVGCLQLILLVLVLVGSLTSAVGTVGLVVGYIVVTLLIVGILASTMGTFGLAAKRSAWTCLIVGYILVALLVVGTLTSAMGTVSLAVEYVIIFLLQTCLMSSYRLRGYKHGQVTVYHPRCWYSYVILVVVFLSVQGALVMVPQYTDLSLCGSSQCGADQLSIFPYNAAGKQNQIPRCPHDDCLAGAIRLVGLEIQKPVGYALDPLTGKADLSSPCLPKGSTANCPEGVCACIGTTRPEDYPNPGIGLVDGATLRIGLGTLTCPGSNFGDLSSPVCSQCTGVFQEMGRLPLDTVWTPPCNQTQQLASYCTMCIGYNEGESLSTNAVRQSFGLWIFSLIWIVLPLIMDVIRFYTLPKPKVARTQ